MDQPDPMAERRRNSAAHYDAVDAAIADRPKAPTYITRVEPIEGGQLVTLNDADDSAIVITTAGAGRISIGLAGDAIPDGASLEVDLFAAGVLANVIRAVAGMTPDKAAPITGSR